MLQMFAIQLDLYSEMYHYTMECCWHCSDETVIFHYRYFTKASLLSTVLCIVLFSYGTRYYKK